MARVTKMVETVTKLTDDYDEKDLPFDTEPTPFTIRGTSYELDLSAANAKKLLKLVDDLAPFMIKARPVGGASTPAKRTAAKKSTGAKAGNGEAAIIREWAAANGIDAGTKGRVKTGARKAWEEAGSPGAK